MPDSDRGRLRIFLVRHGETKKNVEMRYLGLQDEPLNLHGMSQARHLAAAFAEVPLRLIVSSPLGRAVDTAEAIRNNAAVELRRDARLAESSFGSWEGLTRNEVLERGLVEAAALIRWESDASVAPPGGESMADVQARVTSLADELALEFPDASVALVSHVGPIKALLATVLGIPIEASRRLFLDPATISVVDWGKRPLLRLFNSHSHLGWTSARWMR